MAPHQTSFSEFTGEKLVVRRWRGRNFYWRRRCGGGGGGGGGHVHLAPQNPILVFFLLVDLLTKSVNIVSYCQNKRSGEMIVCKLMRK